ncbi:right-handed parallel beta-helix repeat-containing protein [Roseibacillus ishigakijimensis]|uniref:Right-handed parallel beta-helix repeat-containing protein n=1 Tax=Roseibacillus ishigakijimensis TaxID=454146 RepID=A0A934VLK4_9BACT|nr:right-handed parallel beta-helix repeat-containing protein [Roseibacillus ishigakijimensis]MBK1832985.1 right-handed parallel beta-helix repeat-containing protein [Roseibacillus ishigakijimensis]
MAGLVAWLLGGFFLLAEEVHEVSDLDALLALAEKDDQTVRLAPGRYRLSDYATEERLQQWRREGRSSFFRFSGDRNRFLLEGVVLIWETGLREKLRPRIHASEIEVSGSGNLFRGWQILCEGEGTSPGGQLLALSGEGNHLQDCRFEVRGSTPYGYGDSFGKGGSPVIGHRKHSGVLITGNGNRLSDCHLVMRSFGHGYFIQKTASNLVFENCVVEGEVRSTDEMLAEKSGAAFEKGFRTVFRNRNGEHRLLPGYTKSLCEDGFRTYGEHQNLVFRNCEARHMRSGFELRTEGSVQVENCRAVACERGFWVGTRTVMRACEAEARYGPALFLEGENADLELTVHVPRSGRVVHGLAMISGREHRVRLLPGILERELPVWLGFGIPGAGEGQVAFSPRRAEKVKLRNEASSPVVLSAEARGCRVESKGAITARKGVDNEVERLP